MSKIEASAKVLEEMPVAPKGAAETATRATLLETVEGLLAKTDGLILASSDVADAAGVSVEQVEAFFPVPAAATVALAEHYVDLAANVIFADHSGDTRENWEGIVNEVLKRGRVVYKDNPVAKKIRLGTGQSAGLRHLLLESNRLLAERLSDELNRHFIVPEGIDLVDEIAHGIIISDALWSASFQTHGEITDEMAEVAERAVTGYLVQSLGQRLKGRSGSA